MKLIKTLLILSAVAFTMPAFANHEEGHDGESCKRHGPGKHLKEADTNKDGTIDKAEFQAMHDKHFAEMDANKDGKLSKDELAAGKENAKHEKGSRGFAKADKDNDGTLDKQEAKKLPNVSKHFDEIDVDKDGTVDREEIHNFMKDMHKH